jgi:hypothetical protein
MTLIENAKSEPDQMQILSNKIIEKVLLLVLEGMFTIVSIQTKALRTGSHSDIDAYFQDVESALNLLINKFDGLSKGMVIADDGAMKQLETKVDNPAIASFGKAYTYLEIRRG